MKRPRTAEGIKARRAIKKTRGFSDGVCSGSLIYAKLLVAWALLIVADFLLGFRFEYLWPFWLLVRSIYDSFRYQGLAFSVFFVCITVTSDLVCFLFIPVQWLFFLASTYVWVQYVWHADRGICLPTVALWLLFIYVEASVRLKELSAQTTKTLPFALDLCRPFAAHCIGYPVVTMGFGVKSYVGYKFRARRQREVARKNEIYSQLLAEALPSQWQQTPPPALPAPSTSPLNQDLHSGYLSNGVSSPSAGEDLISNGGVLGGDESSFVPPSLLTHTSLKSHHRNNAVAAIANWQQQNASSWCGEKELRPLEDGKDSTAVSWVTSLKRRLFGVDSGGGGGANGGWMTTANRNSQLVGDSDDEDQDSSRGSVDTLTVAERHPSVSSSAKRNHQAVTANGGVGDSRQTSKSRRRTAVNNAKEYQLPSHQHTISTPSTYDVSETNDGLGNSTSSNHTSTKYDRDYDRELTLSLESDLERVKAELRASKVLEHELRQQISHLTNSDSAAKSELKHLRNKNEQLENKLHNLTKARDQDKQAIQTLEKKLVEEQRLRNQSQDQLTLERKQKKADETAAARALAAASKLAAECGESCKSRRRDLDQEIKSLKRELRSREEQLASLEAELQSLRQYREAHNAEVLMSALSTMKEKNLHLEQSLSAENRLKQDLFMALGDAKKQIELIQSQLEKRNNEIEHLQSRLNNAAGGAGSMGGTAGGDGVGGTGPALTPPPPAPGGNSSPPIIHHYHSTGGASPTNEPSMEMLTSAMYNAAAYLSNPYGVIGPTTTTSVDVSSATPFDVVSGGSMSTSARMTFTPPRSSN